MTGYKIEILGAPNEIEKKENVTEDAQSDQSNEQKVKTDDQEK